MSDVEVEHSDNLPHDWGLDAALASLVLVLGIAEAANTRDVTASGGRAALLLVVLATAAVVLAARRLPGVALAAVWAMGLLQVWTGTRLMVVEVAVVVVFFTAARWGRPLTLFLSGLSIPTAAGIAVAMVYASSYDLVVGMPLGRSVLEPLLQLGDGYVLGAGALGIALLGVPWLAGLAFRFGDAAKVSRASQVVAEDDAARARRESEQALEIARLREGQAQLARDVHDVVGHSLAVILAQAESAQYLPEADTEKLRATMANIATSARSSLQDVRHVLQGDDGSVLEQPRPLDTLIDGVRASGHEVVSSEVGVPQPLPPELEVVAYRVLQEMLTNAIKHGRRDEPVFVERHWPDVPLSGDLRIEVRNVAERPAEYDDDRSEGDGQGLAGMRRRLESAGGRLDVRRREHGDQGDRGDSVSFTATAWIPVRTVSQ